MATTVIFYFNAKQPLLAACHILLSQYQRDPQERIAVICKDAAHLDAVDRALWCFKKLSFIPHVRPQHPQAHKTPVLIMDCLPSTPEMFPTYFNLSHHLIPHDSTTTRTIVEVVPFEENHDKKAARERFRHYHDNSAITVQLIDLNELPVTS